MRRLRIAAGARYRKGKRRSRAEGETVERSRGGNAQACCRFTVSRRNEHLTSKPFYRTTLIYGSGSSDLQSMSALPPKADVAERDWYVRFVPLAGNVPTSYSAGWPKLRR
jgi:hypothetical protein